MTDHKPRKPRLPPPPLAHRRQCKNPGAARFNQVYSKRNPRSLEEFSDVELLSIVLGYTAAASVLEHIGTLQNYCTMQIGANLLDHPGISKATAVKLDALYQISVRLG